ncbi:SNF2 domain-containing protein CLASSY 2-like, partial [Herrania umbratica]|uniref:SNF2 domain-containing protein CLASSY 2-like n=1 Tax=Herrania umbratica TaxID=108875 RepID=A0A6J1BA35_9ROSI
MRKRHLYQSKHPFNTYPFEVLFCGSWQAVELIRIKNGVMTMHLIDDQYLIEKQPFSDFRVKSRQATLSDCTCFLRPGIDVCILSASQRTAINEENPEPVWVDAKISSIERKPHNSQCSCQFYVNLYVNQGPLGSEKVILSKETEVVGIDQISVLQRLEKHACDDQRYGWNFSEDCCELRRTKIFLGKFLSDISWLLVTSVLKQIAFDVRSVQNKIVYQILGKDDSSPLNSHTYLHAVNFKVDNGISVSDVVRLDPHQINEAGAACSAHEIRQWPVYDAMNLRRSKRRNVQPERFLGCDSSLETDISWVRTAPLRTGNWREEEEEQELEEDMNLPLSYLFGMNASTSKELTQCETSDVCKSKNISREFKSDVTAPRKSSANYPRRSCVTNPRKHQNSLAIVPVSSESDPLASGHCHAPKFPRNHAEEVEKVSLNYYTVKRSRTTQRKKIPALEYMDYESTWKGISFSKKVQNKSHRSVPTRKEDYDEPITYKRTTISAGAYNKLINSYMKNIDSTFTKEEPHIIDQWNQFKEAASSEMSRKTEPEQPSVEDEGEMSDTEILWREMELCMASAYFEEDEARVSAESLRKSSGNCQHDFKLDEEIGVLCRICGFVRTEIKYVSAPFLEHKSWIADNKVCSEEEPEHKTDGDE